VPRGLLPSRQAGPRQLKKVMPQAWGSDRWMRSALPSGDPTNRSGRPWHKARPLGMRGNLALKRAGWGSSKPRPLLEFLEPHLGEGGLHDIESLGV